MLFIDFEKAFDSLERSFVNRSLEYRFGFGPSLINWVRTFYNNIESCILNNGCESPWCLDFYRPKYHVKFELFSESGQIRNVLSFWNYRRLSLIGKFQVIKSWATSQLTNILTPERIFFHSWALECSVCESGLFTCQVPPVLPGDSQFWGRSPSLTVSCEVLTANWHGQYLN